ncbi:hypothetical protein OZ13_09640 [Xanthomonas cannabis pv. cannabis]|nr:hypothetical protein OZ13_09640 [Xanthomonas cannabis pv. cannabis]
MAWDFCAGDSDVERDALLGLGVFQGADFLAVAFFTAFADVALLLAVPRCADVFLAVVLAVVVEARLVPGAPREATFFTAVFLAETFLAPDFLAGLFAADFLVADFLVADFFVAAFFVADFFVAALRAGVFFVTNDVAPRVFDVCFLAAVFEAPPARVEAPAFLLAPASRRWSRRAAQRWPASPPHSSQAI